MSTLNYHHGDLRGALLHAAEGLLRDVGPAELSLRAVARRAGVSAMAPYRHFADKDALLAGVAADGFDQFARRLRQATATGHDPRSALTAQGQAYILFARDEPALFRLMFGPIISGASAIDALRAAGAPAYAVLQDAVVAFRPDTDPSAREDLTLACWALVHGLACLIVDGNICQHLTGSDIEAQTARILDLLLQDRP
ncbi:MAG TPA: TetR/AcrR family transcriptional regulator [Rhodopila sp.]